MKNISAAFRHGQVAGQILHARGSLSIALGSLTLTPIQTQLLHAAISALDTLRTEMAISYLDKDGREVQK